MTSLKKAPETDAQMPQQAAATKARAAGVSDITAPNLAKKVAFDVCDMEEVNDALAAIEVLKEKPFNQIEGFPEGSQCQQN